MSDSINQLEHKADHHRLQAQNALSSLVSAFAPTTLGKGAVEGASTLTDDLAQTALRRARANPTGLALVGVGAALIALNRPAPKPRTMYGTEAERIARADASIQAQARIASNSPAPSGSKMRQALDAGLDQLPPKARQRVIEARMKAIDAQDAVERKARKLDLQAREAHQAQPFVTALAGRH